jgi:uncharacterized protein YukE
MTLPGLAVLLAMPFALTAQEKPPAKQPQPQKQESVAEAARRAREQKKGAKPAAKVFDNDTVASAGEVVKGAEGAAGEAGQPTPAGAAAGETPAGAEAAGAAARGQEEAAWRKRFADARAKLAQAEKELDVLQREFERASVQYYDDPQKALREQLTRKEINDTRAKVDAKRAEIQQLRQAISDLEDELRRAGLPAGWSRP